MEMKKAPFGAFSRCIGHNASNNNQGTSTDTVNTTPGL